ncbi:MAG: dnaA [Dehalococcoidia bacterium]|nr:dnaA [Dehalococcoidia bacterium]
MRPVTRQTERRLFSAHGHCQSWIFFPLGVGFAPPRPADSLQRTLRRTNIPVNRLAPGQTWEATLGSLELQVSRPIFATWLKDTLGLSFDGDGSDFTVGTPSSFVAEWLEKRMSSLIENTLSQVVGQPMAVHFQVMTEPRATYKPRQASPENPALPASEPTNGHHYSNGTSTFELNPRYTLDSFVVGESNQLAFAAAQAVVSRPGRAYNPLFLYAGVGLGKTHLLHAIGHASAQKGLSYLYASSEQFTNDFITSIQTRRTGEFRKKYRSVDVLLVDDIQFMRGKEAIQEGFFHTFNDLHNANHQIVITSDRPSAALSPLEDRLRSRFEWGLSADMQPPDPETRLAILQAKANSLGITVPKEVLELITESFPRSVRDLEGALNRVSAYADMTSRPLTLEMARQSLADLLNTKQQQVPLPKDVISHVCSFYGVGHETLSSRRRDRSTARARHVAMYLLREVSQVSLSDIGALLGGRDHATVRLAWMKISQVKDTDRALQVDLAAIRESIYKSSSQ